MNSWIINLLSIIASLMCIILSGCASTSTHDSEAILARILREIESEDANRAKSGSSQQSVGTGAQIEGRKTSHSGSDTPSSPASALPDDDEFQSRRMNQISKGPPVNPKLTIQPDSIVQISVAEDSSLDGTYPVNDIGAVDLNYIGPIILLNKTEDQAAAKIGEVLIAREFRKATVKVKTLRASYDKLRISGAVENPGLIRIGAGDRISLNNALLRVGGIKASAKGTKIRIVRDALLSAVGQELPGEEYSLLDAEGKPSVPNVMLDNNDLITVFSSETKATDGLGFKEILVVGEVNRPGIYRFVSGEPCTIMHLTFKMGGLPMYANKKEIVITRRSDDGSEKNINVSITDILKEGDPEEDIALENGDRVVVPTRRLSIF